MGFLGSWKYQKFPFGSFKVIPWNTTYKEKVQIEYERLLHWEIKDLFHVVKCIYFYNQLEFYPILNISFEINI